MKEKPTKTKEKGEQNMRKTKKVRNKKE